MRCWWDFFEGDPDRPDHRWTRTYNRGATPPDQAAGQGQDEDHLEAAARTPGGEGFNEISMDDAAGEELLFVQAQHNLETKVLNDEKKVVGANLETNVRKDERRAVAGNQAIKVTGNRVIDVDGKLTTRSDSGLQTQAGEQTGISCVDGRLVITNGTASIVLDGPHVHIDAQANVRISAGQQLGLYGKQVGIDGTPEVFINSARAIPPAVARLSVAERAERGREPTRGRGGRERPPGRGNGRPQRPGGMREAEFDRRRNYRDLTRPRPRRPNEAPRAIQLPREMNDQLKLWSRRSQRAGISQGVLIDPDTYNGVVNRVDRRLEAERLRVTRLGRDLNNIFARQRNHFDELGETLNTRLDEEKLHFADVGDEYGAIFSDEEAGFFKTAGAAIKLTGETIVHIAKLGGEIVSMLAAEAANVMQFVGEMTSTVMGIQRTIEYYKELIRNPQQLLRDLLGDDLADMFGVDGPDDRLPGGRDPGNGRPPDPGNGRPRDPGNNRPPDPGRSPNRPADPGRPGQLNDRGRHNAMRNPMQGPDKGPELNDRGRHNAMRNPTQGPGQGSELNSQGRGKAIRGADKMAPTEKPKLNERGKSNSIRNADKMAPEQPRDLSNNGRSKALRQGFDGPGTNQMSGDGPMIGGQREGVGLASSTPGAGDLGNSTALAASGVGGAGKGSELSAGSAMARDGGLAASDVVGTVGSEQPSFLHSPGDGQMMVVATEAAQPLDTGSLSSSMVDAQMDGGRASNAIAQQLTDQGYAVYQRGADDWFGEMVRFGQNAATQA